MSEQYLTHYQVLGIPITANEREIKVAYRKAARVAHPDQGGDPASFRRVTAAYETLIDPQRRQAYDRSYGGTSSTGPRPGESGRWEESARTPAEGAAGAGFFTTSRRPNEPRNVAGEPAVYFPPYEDVPAGTSPLIPLAKAAQQVHGAPRKRGMFGAHARLAREARTAQLVMAQLLPQIPSARLVNGLSSPAGNGYIDHAIVVGYRIALVGSMLLPEGAYRWDGSTLAHGGKSLQPPLLVPAVRRMQELFPECNVTAWVCVHSSSGNQFEPVIDYARGCEPDGSNLVNVANSARFIREVKHFLGSGPSPNVVDLQVLSRLLGGMY